MNLRAYLFEEDRGVSPVIGVILMVAITVILAAVIATFVMNMGPSQSTPANANWDGSFDTSSSSHTFTLTHEGGGAATTSEYALSIEDASSGGDDPDGDYNLDASAFGHTDEMTASDSVEVTQSNLDTISSSSITGDLDLSGATIQLIWEDPEGDQTQIIRTWEE